MKARTFILLIGLAMAIGGVVLGLVKHDASAYGKTFTCGSAFNSDTREAVHWDGVEYLVGSYRVGNQPTRAQDACEDAALSPFIPWGLVIAGAVIAVGALVIREPKREPTQAGSESSQ